MKVQQIQNNNIELKNKPQFKGVDGFLRYLATNQAVGANGVDLAFMVIPRTGTDLINRGPAAGLETGRREASGTVNHTLIGVYGGLTGALIAAVSGINSKYNANANSIMSAKETLNILAENKARQIKNSKHQIDYLKETLSQIKAFNPSSELANAEGYISLSDKKFETMIDEIARIMDDAINEKGMDFKRWKKKGMKNSFDVVVNKIIEKTGAESKYLLESADKKTVSETSLKTLLEDIYKVSEAFNRSDVKDAFKNQVENNKSILENDFVKSLTKFNKSKAIAGFALASAIGMSIQPINIYLTKLKTGSDGFVGVEGREKDKSTGFKALKVASAGAFFGMVLATLQTGLKGFMDKMAFKGFWPTISQLKGIYGLTIMSRILATRDKDELREALTKDTLGFLSWLVLGDFVNKMVAEGLDKKLDETVMNRTKDVSKKGFFGRVFNSKLKTRDEVLIEALAKKEIATTKEVDGKLVAKTFKEMIKDMEGLPEGLRNATKKRLGVLNKAQLAGYLFSGLVLGLGIPNLNIYITNKLDKKRKVQEVEKQAQQVEQSVAQVEETPQELQLAKA